MTNKTQKKSLIDEITTNFKSKIFLILTLISLGYGVHKWFRQAEIIDSQKNSITNIYYKISKLNTSIEAGDFLLGNGLNKQINTLQHLAQLMSDNLINTEKITDDIFKKQQYIENIRTKFNQSNSIVESAFLENTINTFSRYFSQIQNIVHKKNMRGIEFENNLSRKLKELKIKIDSISITDSAFTVSAYPFLLALNSRRFILYLFI